VSQPDPSNPKEPYWNGHLPRINKTMDPYTPKYRSARGLIVIAKLGTLNHQKNSTKKNIKKNFAKKFCKKICVKFCTKKTLHCRGSFWTGYYLEVSFLKQFINPRTWTIEVFYFMSIVILNSIFDDWINLFRIIPVRIQTINPTLV
jgi:magnesium-transporting ATPase (P-type)